MGSHICNMTTRVLFKASHLLLYGNGNDNHDDDDDDDKN